MNKLLAAINYILDRLNEPSTHSSIAALTALAGLSLDAGVLHDSLVAVSVCAGALGFFVKES